jgi:hypothetical protein
VNRLPALQDLSAHHASSDHSVPEGGAGSGEAFRDGMEGDERECGWYPQSHSYFWAGRRDVPTA